MPAEDDMPVVLLRLAGVVGEKVEVLFSSHYHLRNGFCSRPWVGGQPGEVEIDMTEEYDDDATALVAGFWEQHVMTVRNEALGDVEQYQTAQGHYRAQQLEFLKHMRQAGQGGGYDFYINLTAYETPDYRAGAALYLKAARQLVSDRMAILKEVAKPGEPNGGGLTAKPKAPEKPIFNGGGGQHWLLFVGDLCKYKKAVGLSWDAIVMDLHSLMPTMNSALSDREKFSLPHLIMWLEAKMPLRRLEPGLRTTRQRMRLGGGESVAQLVSRFQIISIAVGDLPGSNEDRSRNKRQWEEKEVMVKGDFFNAFPAEIQRELRDLDPLGQLSFNQLAHAAMQKESSFASSTNNPTFISADRTRVYQNAAYTLHSRHNPWHYEEPHETNPRDEPTKPTTTSFDSLPDSVRRQLVEQWMQEAGRSAPEGQHTGKRRHQDDD